MPNARSHHSPTLWEETKPPLVRFCNHTVFGLTLGVLIIAPLAFGAVRPWAQGPLMIAVAVAALLWMLRILVERGTEVVFSPLGAPVLVLGTYVIVRYTLAEVEPVSRPDMMLAISALLFFFLVLNTVRHRTQISALVWVLTLMGTALALYGVWQVVRGGRWVWWFPQYDVYLGCASATFIRPADLAVYLHMTFAVAAANFLFSRRSMAQKTVLAFACLIMGGALLVTFTHFYWLGWLASFLVLAAYVIRKRGWRFRWIVIGTSVLVVVVMVAMITAYALRHRPDSNENPEEGMSLKREMLENLPERQPTATEAAKAAAPPFWQSAVAIGQRNLWLGSGPGMFPWLYPAYRTVQGRPEEAGNQYLDLFADYGVIGCLLVLWLIVSFARASYHILALRAERYSAATLSNRYAFAVAGLAAIAAMLVDAALHTTLRVGANLFTFVAVMAAALTCGVHHHSSGDEENIYQPGRHSALRLVRASRFVLVGGLLVLVVMLASRLRQTYPASLLARLAEQEVQRLQWNAANNRYLQAWRFDHRNFELATALGDFYSARATWNSRQREKLCGQAFSWYERATTLNPYATDVLVRMARLHDALGKREQATETFERVLQADPKNASYHTQLGLHYQRWGDTEQAAKSFRRAAELGDTETLAFAQLQRLNKLGP